VEIVPVTLEQAEFACQAIRRYGSAATLPVCGSDRRKAIITPVHLWR
jgi:hypothetical protein